MEERVDATTRNSEEQLWKHDGGIMVTFSVDIEAHVAHPLSPPLAEREEYQGTYRYRAQ